MGFMQKKLPTPVRPRLQSRDDTAAELKVNVRTVDKLNRSKSQSISRDAPNSSTRSMLAAL
jgi:hypothetical protein